MLRITSVAAHPRLRKLLTHEIPNYQLEYPYPHVSRQLHKIVLVHYHKDQVGTTRFKIMSFDVKSTLTLNYAIVKSETLLFASIPRVILIVLPNSTHLFAIGRSSNHFIYSVTLDYTGSMISRSCTQANYLAAVNFSISTTLSYFRSLFSGTSPWTIHSPFILIIVSSIIQPKSFYQINRCVVYVSNMLKNYLLRYIINIRKSN